MVWVVRKAGRLAFEVVVSATTWASAVAIFLFRPATGGKFVAFVEDSSAPPSNAADDAAGRAPPAEAASGAAEAALAQMESGLSPRSAAPAPVRRINVLAFGLAGAGQSSALNTLAGRAVLLERGGQLAGTRGVQQAVIESPAPCPGVDTAGFALAFADCAGLSPDRIATDHDMVHYAGTVAHGAVRLPGNQVSVLMVTINVETRLQAAALANLVGILQMFKAQQSRCFLALTHWNTNPVMAEWNSDLLALRRQHPRKSDFDARSFAPPPPSAMMAKYREYLTRSFSESSDAVAAERMMKVLDFFEDRVLWICPLDVFDREDLAEGNLDPYIAALYKHYRAQALATLLRASPEPIPSSVLSAPHAPPPATNAIFPT